MFLKPDYNLKNIYEINLEELKSRGIKNILFDLDSTLMQSKTANYTQKTLEWLSEVRRDFFVAVLSNNHNCLLYTSPSPRDRTRSRMPSSA